MISCNLFYREIHWAQVGKRHFLIKYHLTNKKVMIVGFVPKIGFGPQFIAISVQNMMARIIRNWWHPIVRQAQFLVVDVPSFPWADGEESIQTFKHENVETFNRLNTFRAMIPKTFKRLNPIFCGAVWTCPKWVIWVNKNGWSRKKQQGDVTLSPWFRKCAWSHAVGSTISWTMCRHFVERCLNFKPIHYCRVPSYPRFV